MDDKFYIDGICCEFCKKKESSDCPIGSASPWSRWKNFCNEFEHEKTRLTIFEIFKEK